MFYVFNNFKKRIPFPFIDVYLFKWNELTPSGIHDHASSGCYILLLKGSIKEMIYNHSCVKLKTNNYKAPSISYMNNHIGLHSIEPLEKSVSIHFYYPKNHVTNYYSKNNIL